MDRRESSLRTWIERMNREYESVTHSFECFKEYEGDDDIDWLIGDLKAMLKSAENVKKAIAYMDGK